MGLIGLDVMFCCECGAFKRNPERRIITLETTSQTCSKNSLRILFLLKYREKFSQYSRKISIKT